MKAHTCAVIEAGGRLTHVSCQAPLTLRQVRSDDSDVCALCLVGTAAGPLAGDDLTLELILRTGAQATLQAAGAGLAQGTGGTRTMRTTVGLHAGAQLVARAAPLIVARGGRIDVAVSIDLAADAAIDWQELIVLGRTGEAPGAATVRWDVIRAGRPVLRQYVDLADPVLANWRGMVNGARVLATRLVVDPSQAARTVVHSPLAVTARLDEHSSLTTVLGDDAAAVHALLRRTALETAQ
jgi:urease accessory protein